MIGSFFRITITISHKWQLNMRILVSSAVMESLIHIPRINGSILLSIKSNVITMGQAFDTVKMFYISLTRRESEEDLMS